MEKIKYYIEKYKILIIFIIIIIFLTICLIFSMTKKSSTKIKKLETESVKLESKEELKNNKEEISDTIIKPNIIKVDIKGLVENPGVYQLDENSRVIDVINIAGGLKEGANTEYINLSKKVTDEMVIIIYSESDVEKYKQTDKQVIYIEYECVCPDNKNDACITDKDTVNTNGVKDKDNINSSKDDNKTNSNDDEVMVSINTGTLEELMTLKGVGESKAKAIIEYREKNGEFKNLEDIMNVSGIGEAAYSKIKDNIKL